MCNSHTYIPVLWASLSAPIPRRFENQSLGFLDLTLRCEQIKHYLLVWTYFAWVTPWEIFQVLLSTSFLSLVQWLSRVQLFTTPWTAARQASLNITNSQSPPKPMSIESMKPSNHLILCRPLLLPPIPPSIKVFCNESTLRTRWPKYWSFSFSIIPSKEIPGPISFRMDWLDLLVVQGTLKSLLQHHSS